jgi:hypothetical protein
MQLKVIYDGTLLSSAPRNLSQSFTGGQYLYFDPQLGENLALMIGVAWLIKLPGVNGDLLKVWETSNSLRVIASYLLQKIQTKREKYSVKKKQSSKRRKGYYLKKVSE